MVHSENEHPSHSWPQATLGPSPDTATITHFWSPYRDIPFTYEQMSMDILKQYANDNILLFS